MNGDLPAGYGTDFRQVESDKSQPEGRWKSETWPQFRDQSAAEPQWLIRGQLYEEALVFIAAPPKKGKTWIGLALSLALATGTPLFGEYEVIAPRPVLYVALEGSRPGLRARTGALARGLGVDPDSDELERLHMLYRPRPFNLAELETANWLREEADRIDAALVVVDVLRAAARFNENAAEDFARIRDSLEPMLAAGRTVALLHHFGKLTDTQKERSPGERMAGTGAMYGALDVGFLITRSENGARRLRVEIEARDFAAPDPLGVVILGNGSGENGGFGYLDTATVEIDATAAEERNLADELEELYADGVWRTAKEASAKEAGIGANLDDVRAALEASPNRFALVEGARVGRHATAKPWGTVAMLLKLNQAEEVTRASESPESPQPLEQEQLRVGAGDSPYGGAHRVTCSHRSM